MHLTHLLLPRQTNCVVCPDPPPCTCDTTTQDCFQINRDCNTCSTFKCVPKPGITKTSAGGGTSKGALAGAIVGSLIFVALAIGLFLWYRRRTRANELINASRELKVVDKPAAAETVLSRPDPLEKASPAPSEIVNNIKVYSSASSTTINLDPESHPAQNNPHFLAPHPAQNPFDDGHSIQTAGTEGTNVIPIALIPPEAQSQASRGHPSPVRPVRSPDLNLNLEHVNVSRDSSLHPGGTYAQSQVSGISGLSSRQSYMTNASYSSELLEAPAIITPAKTAVRQVLGVVKAEVINAPGTNRPPATSPLAVTSFGPSDVVKEADESSVVSGNPFGDDGSPPPSAPASTTTFGHPSPAAVSSAGWDPQLPHFPWSRNPDSRPSSVSTQAVSIVDIGSATRVNVGLGGLKAELASSPRSPYRTTMGRLVTPPSGAPPGTLEDQQQRALAHAQARAQAQGLDKNKRISGSSAISTSTRADSILESFPFVPPSPISDRPMRSPPVSPVAQQFNGAPRSPLAQQTTFRQQQRVAKEEDSSIISSASSDLPPPPDRRTLGMSTGSQLSTASSGLGSFPFQIDQESSADGHSMPSAASRPPPAAGRQRASLDTLALTSDLSSYPLDFDRSRMPPPMPTRK
ncbi:hypothetical protein HGRIS_009969 [Hohenbuehelia grisea]|uniref:Membrane anchor Opy2 N-terminal domain-containing protein n=1 Tax=Hohenbuehelia grisea TaxID=104357 RepID=A0ABR3J2U4_9AGAR